MRLHPAAAARRRYLGRRRLRSLRLWIEIASVLLGWVTPVQAAPLALFFSGLTAGLGLGGATVAFTASAYGIGIAAGQFLAANWIYLAAVGAAALLNAVQQRSAAASSVNVRVDVGYRRHGLGQVKLGGQAIFGSFDDEGAWWQIVVHCDEELRVPGSVEVRLDDIPVTINGSHEVTTDDFQAWSGGLLGQFQSRTPFYKLWVLTWTPGHPVPTPIADFTAKFADWTANHKLAGMTTTIMRIAPCDDKQIPQVFKWQQGAFGALSAPGVSLVGTFGRVYDPRDPAQDIDDQSTWGSSRNVALMLAWNRYRPYGFETPAEMDDFDWDSIATEADVCDGLVRNKLGGTAPRYAAGLAFDESRTAGDIEQMLLAAADAMVVTNSDGLVWFRVGRYEAPTVEIVTARDQMGVDSVAIDDGESELDGYEIIYTEPEYDHQLVPAAPYLNPRYYVPGTSPRLKQVTIEAIQNHNQAVRIAKALSEMTQPGNKLSQQIGAIGLLAKDERIVGCDYEEFSGSRQIAAPTQFDLGAMTGQIVTVPVTPNSWDLLPGEEGDRPRRDVVNLDASLPLLDPADVDLSAEPVAGTNGNSVRIRGNYPAVPSPIYSYEFDYSTDGGTTFQLMSTDINAQTTLSPDVNAGLSVLVHWRTVSSGGNYSAYSSNVTVFALAHLTMDVTGVRLDSTSFTLDAA